MSRSRGSQLSSELVAPERNATTSPEKPESVTDTWARVSSVPVASKGRVSV
jgi:hypothetical protein